jgi:hypothetical protein
MPAMDEMPTGPTLQLITYDAGTTPRRNGLNPGRARTTTLTFH